jgi:hypothetical protein
MRKLIIILAIFVLLFATVLVWGVTRDRDPPPFGEDQAINCNGLPRMGNGDIDTGRMKEWTNKCVGKRMASAANRFTPGNLLEPVEIPLAGNRSTAIRELVSIDDEDKIRVVKLEKVSGGAIEVTTKIDGEDQELCLCEPEDRLSDKDNNRICKVSVSSGKCPPESERGSFAVGPDGARFQFTSLFKAKARSIKK